MNLLRKSRENGLVFFTYIGLYSMVRFFIESLRTDSLMFGAIKMAQLVSLLGIVLWGGFFILSRRKTQSRT